MTMANTAKRGRVGAAPIELVTPDNPRIVERTSDGARARVTDQGEYVSMTSAQGYRDVTDNPAPAARRPAAPTAPTGGAA